MKTEKYMGGKQWKPRELGSGRSEVGDRKWEFGSGPVVAKALPGKNSEVGTQASQLPTAHCPLPDEAGRRSWGLTVSLYHYILFLLLFFISSTAAAQPPVDTFLHLRTYPEKAIYFEVDKLQQVYLVQENNTIIKYQADGTEQFRYNDNTRGPLQYLDPTDPFNVLLFYPGFQAITTLDRTMNERASQLLYNGPVINASAIGLARDNNIWVYDQASFTLHKVASDGQSILNSGNLSAILNKAPIVQQVVARGNWVYLFSPEQGVFVFDNFAQFHQLLPYEGYSYMQVQAPLILLLENSKSIAYHTERLQDFPVPLPPQAEKAEAIRWRGDQCYLLMPDGKVRVYLKKER